MILQIRIGVVNCKRMKMYNLPQFANSHLNDVYIKKYRTYLHFRDDWFNHGLTDPLCLRCSEHSTEFLAKKVRGVLTRVLNAQLDVIYAFAYMDRRGFPVNVPVETSNQALASYPCPLASYT